MPLRIAAATANDCEAYGRLLVEAYASLDGFPKPGEQPDYYRTLADVGQLARKPGVSLLVARDAGDRVVGGVASFADMAHYGSGGRATGLADTSGIRFLAVAPDCRGQGVGCALTQACLDLALASGHGQVVLHTTRAMAAAWRMYEQLGFVRAQELDFLQGGLAVYGFGKRLR